MTLYEATLYHHSEPLLKCVGRNRLWALIGLGEKVLQERRWLSGEYGYFPWREMAECLSSLRRPLVYQADKGPVRIEVQTTYTVERRRRPGEPSARTLLRCVLQEFYEVGVDCELGR